MVNDCYWKHGSTAEERFICLDRKNEVCPRCCVEHCPAEAPEWFADCSLSGHQTWPSRGSDVPRKLVCLESSWDDRIFQTLSVKGFFESLSPLIRPPLLVAHRFVELLRHLSQYTRKPDGLLWTDPVAYDAPVIYLAFHGSPGAIDTALERIGPGGLCDAFDGYGSVPVMIYLGSCSVLKGDAGKDLGTDLLETSGARALLGYATDVDWMNSLIVDMLFLQRFYTHADPWNNLEGIYHSILEDFGPAEKMGYTLMQKPAAG
jgi:hypothetical protein